MENPKAPNLSEPQLDFIDVYLLDRHAGKTVEEDANLIPKQLGHFEASIHQPHFRPGKFY
jgi:hypothetical protein